MASAASGVVRDIHNLHQQLLALCTSIESQQSLQGPQLRSVTYLMEKRGELEEIRAKVGALFRDFQLAGFEAEETTRVMGQVSELMELSGTVGDMLSKHVQDWTTAHQPPTASAPPQSQSQAAPSAAAPTSEVRAQEQLRSPGFYMDPAGNIAYQLTQDQIDAMRLQIGTIIDDIVDDAVSKEIFTRYADDEEPRAQVPRKQQEDYVCAWLGVDNINQLSDTLYITSVKTQVRSMHLENWTRVLSDSRYIGEILVRKFGLKIANGLVVHHSVDLLKALETACNEDLEFVSKVVIGRESFLGDFAHYIQGARGIPRGLLGITQVTDKVYLMSELALHAYAIAMETGNREILRSFGMDPSNPPPLPGLVMDVAGDPQQRWAAGLSIDDACSWRLRGMCPQHHANLGLEDVSGVEFPLKKGWVDALSLAVENDQVVYVYCRAGLSRSATVVLAYLVEEKRKQESRDPLGSAFRHLSRIRYSQSKHIPRLEALAAGRDPDVQAVATGRDVGAAGGKWMIPPHKRQEGQYSPLLKRLGVTEQGRGGTVFLAYKTKTEIADLAGFKTQHHTIALGKSVVEFPPSNPAEARSTGRSWPESLEVVLTQEQLDTLVAELKRLQCPKEEIERLKADFQDIHSPAPAADPRGKAPAGGSAPAVPPPAPAKNGAGGGGGGANKASSKEAPQAEVKPVASKSAAVAPPIPPKPAAPAPSARTTAANTNGVGQGQLKQQQQGPGASPASAQQPAAPRQRPAQNLSALNQVLKQEMHVRNQTALPEDGSEDYQAELESRLQREASEIFPNVYIGGRLSAQAILPDQGGNPTGFTRVISIGNEYTTNLGGEFPASVKRIIISEPQGATPSAWDVLFSSFEQAFALIRAARQAGEPILIHCSQGKNRSVILVAAYLIDQCGFTDNEALEFIRRNRLCAIPQDTLLSGLHNYYLAHTSQCSQLPQSQPLPAVEARGAPAAPAAKAVPAVAASAGVRPASAPSAQPIPAAAPKKPADASRAPGKEKEKAKTKAKEKADVPPPVTGKAKGKEKAKTKVNAKAEAEEKAKAARAQAKAEAEAAKAKAEAKAGWTKFYDEALGPRTFGNDGLTSSGQLHGLLRVRRVVEPSSPKQLSKSVQTSSRNGSESGSVDGSKSRSKSSS